LSRRLPPSRHIYVSSRAEALPGTRVSGCEGPQSGHARKAKRCEAPASLVSVPAGPQRWGFDTHEFHCLIRLGVPRLRKASARDDTVGVSTEEGLSLTYPINMTTTIMPLHGAMVRRQMLNARA